MQGGKKLSSWNIFVKKIYSEGKSADSNYSFKQALSDASKRKGEMGQSAPVQVGTKSSRKSKKSKKSKKQKSKKCKCPKKGTRRK
jgi:hypothetical protein